MGVGSTKTLKTKRVGVSSFGLLTPTGLMALGLYSKITRQQRVFYLFLLVDLTLSLFLDVILR